MTKTVKTGGPDEVVAICRDGEVVKWSDDYWLVEYVREYILVLEMLYMPDKERRKLSLCFATEERVRDELTDPDFSDG